MDKTLLSGKTKWTILIEEMKDIYPVFNNVLIITHKKIGNLLFHEAGSKLF